jgi:flagellar biosynthesis protein FlhG
MARQNGRQVFEIVVNKVKSEVEAKAIFDNMAQVAERNLQVQLVYMGYIPVDEKLQRATQLCRPVMEAFPRSPCAIAFNALAQNLVQANPDLDDGEVGLTNIMQRLMQQTRPPRVVSAFT